MLINKKPSANNNEDFISELPDALLIQILSLLPESSANQTRILSKRWKNLYAFLPNLHFVLQFRWPMEQVITFYDFIDQTLSIRNNVPIQSFFLDSFKNCESTRLYRCLSTVVHLKVQQLYIRLTDDIYCDSIRFDCELFKTCNTLVELTLTGGFELVVPNQAGLLFPSLKKLVLIIVAYSREAFTNLISGCPVLEELIAERKIVGKRDNFAYIFCSRSLKRLTIRISSIYVYKAVIDAPKLEYLYISDKNFVLTEPLSLVEAHISYASRYADQLVSCLSSAKILTLTNTTIRVIFSYSLKFLSI
ncbi:F-box domain, cyclin-like protein [Artemisia annua]|uniref:F-box domain, cyclin-like protein n=1 Tax=Artemisia annua TaxID=35608 RepID=A0A2U1PQI8_ARTAN|nr:F-box domain, cyclin-like protein [Artemisia annua]